MKEYKEGEAAFWSGKPLMANAYLGGDPDSFRNWHRGWLFAQSVSTMGGTPEW